MILFHFETLYKGGSLLRNEFGIKELEINYFFECRFKLFLYNFIFENIVQSYYDWNVWICDLFILTLCNWHISQH